MKTEPILYLVFNRPDLVERSFSAIRKVKPEKFYVAADGPRENRPDDMEKCSAVREYIKSHIDWPCEAKFLFREENLGCGHAVSQAIDWFFENEEKGIILEDDCIPNLSFFNFCSELLQKYQTDKSIYQITGSNWQKGIWRGKADYYFSHVTSVWGWATWRDRWEQYSFDLNTESNEWRLMEENLVEVSSSLEEANYHLNSIKKTAVGEIDTWDYQWRYLVFLNKGKVIVPNLNLVSNAGHREDGTHTLHENHWRSNLGVEELNFPINHPVDTGVNHQADKFLSDNLWSVKKKQVQPSFANKVKFKLKSMLSRLIK